MKLFNITLLLILLLSTLTIGCSDNEEENFSVTVYGVYLNVKFLHYTRACHRQSSEHCGTIENVTDKKISVKITSVGSRSGEITIDYFVCLPNEVYNFPYYFDYINLYVYEKDGSFVGFIRNLQDSMRATPKLSK